MEHDEGTTTLPWEPSAREELPPGLEDVLRANLQGDLHELRPEPGLVIDGKWELTSLLGAGGFGQVYEAWHLQLDHPVAIKFLDARHGGPEVRRRFLEEARLMAGMASEHLVRASDYGELPNGAPYFVMELVKGRTVRHHMREPMSIARVVEIVEGILQGLSAIHGRGVVHADIKPENIIIGDHDGKVRLLDFGLARTSQPLEGNSGGTPPYMAPEMLLDDAVAGPRTDVYAVGVVAYEMLAARLPRGHLSMDFGKMRRAWTSRPNADPVQMYRAEIPQAFDVFVMEALSRDPFARPKSATAMLEALRELMPRIGAETVAETLPQPETDNSWSTKPITVDEASTASRRGWLAPAAVVGVALAAWLVGRCDRQDTENPRLAVARIDYESSGGPQAGLASREGIGDDEGERESLAAANLEGDTLAVPSSRESTTGSIESEHVDEPVEPPESSTSSSVSAVDPESKKVRSPQPKRRPPRSDQQVVNSLRSRILAKCKDTGDRKVIIEGIISTSGKLEGVLVTPRDGPGSCVYKMVENARFAPEPSMRPMPRLSVDL